jgi:phage shock protein A
MYSERYQEFQNAIQQSSQMVTSCHTEIEKMGKKIKKLEKERNDFRHRWEIAEQNQRKSSEDVRERLFLILKCYFDCFFSQYKLLEKEKRQLETKLDKLDKLSRALQQERSELQTTIKNLSKPASAISSSTENDSSTPVAGLNSLKQQI